MTGPEIRELRKALGWTQQRLAEACGVTRRAVIFWEQGQREPGGSSKIILRGLRTSAGSAARSR